MASKEYGVSMHTQGAWRFLAINPLTHRLRRKWTVPKEPNSFSAHATKLFKKEDSAFDVIYFLITFIAF
jgi:hypothetical protein